MHRTQRASKRARREEVLHAPLPQLTHPVLNAHEDFYPDYPEDWIDITEEARSDYLLPTHTSNIPSRTTYALAETSAAAAQCVREALLALRALDTELHEHANTVHGIKDLKLAQNRDVHELAVKKLVIHEPIDKDIFQENVRAFAPNY